MLLEGDFHQVLRLLGGGGAEQHRLALLHQQPDDLLHLLLEADVRDPVGLVKVAALEVLEEEALDVLEVVQEAAGGDHEDVDTFRQLLGLTANTHEAQAGGQPQPV